MIHHLSIAVTDLERAATFYDAVLTPLGYARVFKGDESVGYGYSGKGDKLLLNLEDKVSVPGEGFHLAFSAAEPEHVDRFHAAALLHGGRCNGRPGPRPDYGDRYYAAFVFDPDGYRIEAVVNQGPKRWFSARYKIQESGQRAAHSRKRSSCRKLPRYAPYGWGECATQRPW